MGLPQGKQMIVSLAQKWTLALRRLPESGMGYQYVDVCLRNGSIFRDVIVFNGEQMEWPDDSRPIRSEDIDEITMSKTAH